ncbi:MAG: ribonuclease T [Gammaproteobacteria bacterium]|nr:ribonuclease T [Gammaproteobacteria bacterium]
MSNRFRGYYPIVVDVETGGLDPEKNALLEVAAISLTLNDELQLCIEDRLVLKIKPDPQCAIVPEALKINKIDLSKHNETAIDEPDALREFFGFARKAIKKHDCLRGILVGHNATFDLSFIHAAAERHQLKRNPFHPFSVIDTVGLAGLFYGQTVLKIACEKAEITFKDSDAHNALYDAEKTAELFCAIHNLWLEKGNFPKKKP